MLRSNIATFKMLANVHEPVVGVCGLGIVAEGLRLVCEKLVEGIKLRLIVSLALTYLVAMPLVVLLQELQKHLSVGIGGCHDSLPCLRRWRWWQRVQLIPIIAVRILTR